LLKNDAFLGAKSKFFAKIRNFFEKKFVISKKSSTFAAANEKKVGNLSQKCMLP